MAFYANGEPLPLRDAVALYSAQVSYGTLVTPATSLGLVRAAHTQRSNVTGFRSPGSPSIQVFKGGDAYVEWELNWQAVQAGSKTFLLNAVRAASKMLPIFTLGLGYQDDTATPAKSADQIQDCKMGSLSLNLDASNGHAPLTATASGVGLLAAASTALVAAHLTTAPYMSYEAAFTNNPGGGGAAAYPIRSLSVNVNHNLQRATRLPGSTPASFQRGHFGLIEHNEDISGSVSLFVRSGQAVLANTITLCTLVCTLTNLDDSSTLVLTLTNCAFDNERYEMADGGIVWSFDFQAKTWSIA